MDLCREKEALPAGSGESAGEGMLCVLKSSFGSCSPTLEFSFLLETQPQVECACRNEPPSCCGYVFSVNLYVSGEEFYWWENTFHSPSGPQDPVKLRKRPLASSQQIFSLQIYPVYKQKAEVGAIRELGKRRCPTAHHINHIFTMHAYLGKRSKLFYKGSLPS